MVVLFLGVSRSIWPRWRLQALHCGINAHRLSWQGWYQSQIYWQQGGAGYIECGQNRWYGSQIQGFFCTAVVCAYLGSKSSVDDYVQAAWQAWWMYLAQHQVIVVNRPNHQMLSASYLSVLAIYQQASRLGMATPKWQFDSRCQRRPNWPVCALQQLTVADDFRSALAQGPLYVEQNQADAILVLCLEKSLFAYNLEQRCLVAIDPELSAKIVALVQQLGLQVAELFFRAQQDWVLYRVGLIPQWQTVWRQESVLRELMRMFSNTYSSQTFIPPELRA